MSTNSILTLLVLLALFVYLGRKLLSTRDLLLVAATAGTIGFGLAGIFYSWSLIVALLLLAAESFYLGFIYKTKGGGAVVQVFNRFMQRRSRTAFVMSIGLIAFVIFAVDQGRQDIDALLNYIEIYEPNSSVEPVWKVDEEQIATVILHTEDPASAVLEFYEQIAKRDGWEVSSYSPPYFASFRKIDIKLTLMAQESAPEDTTVIITLDRLED